MSYRLLNPKTGQLEYFEGEKPRKIPKPLNRGKPPATMGQKRRKRIVEEGSETQCHVQIWMSRPRRCDVCGCQIFQFHRWNFPHILSKLMYPQFRLMLENYGLVCSPECHADFDKLWVDLEKRRLFAIELEEIKKKSLT